MLRLITILKPYSGYALAAWATTIIIVSSLPGLPTLKLHTSRADIRLDYLMHFCEYGFLSFLAFLSFSGREFRPGFSRMLTITAALIIFATADEFHQKIIPGRTFNIRDLIGNFLGIAAGFVFCVVVFGFIRKCSDRSRPVRT